MFAIFFVSFCDYFGCYLSSTLNTCPTMHWNSVGWSVVPSSAICMENENTHGQTECQCSMTQ